MYKTPYVIFVLSLMLVNAFASSTGPKGPGTATTSGSISYNWTSASNVLTDNNSAATVAITGKNNISNTLRMTNFGFVVPGAATITGILVEVRMQGASGKTMDQLIQLRKTAGLVGNNKARKNATWPRHAPKYRSFGSSTDLWGTTWTAAEINSTDFGIDIIAKAKKQLTSSRVEYVRITVYYNQTKFYPKSSGNLNVLSSWGSNTDGTGTAPANFTNDGQVFVLRNRATPTLAANFTISGEGSKLVVGDGTTACNFTIPGSFSYTGVIDISNNATLTCNNTTVPTIGAIANGAETSYVVFGANGNQTVPGRSYYRLTVSGTGIKTLSGTGNAEEKLIIGSGATFHDAGYFFSVDGNIENSGTHTSITTGKLMMDGTVAQSIAGSNGIFGNLDIFNASHVTLTTGITVTGFLKFSEGELKMGANTLTLNGTTTYETGTLTGGTSANLVIGGTGTMDTLKFTTGSETLNNLTLNRTSTGKVTLTTVLNVRNILTMTAGNIINGNNTITLGTSTSSRGTLTHTSGIIVGKCSRWFTNATNTGTTGLFPVGTQSDYRPVTINYTAAPSVGGKITAEFLATSPGDLGLSPALNDAGQSINKAGESGYWDLTATTLSGGTCTSKFTGTNFSGVMDYTKLRMLKRTGSGASWTLAGTHGTCTGSNSAPIITRTGLTSMGQFGFGGDNVENPLPVTLVSFTGKRIQDVVTLKWVTASEVNSAYFEVEKSYDLKNWRSVTTIPAAGNSEDLAHYETKDAADGKGVIYYRLRAVDLDRTFAFSDAVSAYPDKNYKSSIQCFPNPVERGTNVIIKNVDELTNLNPVMVTVYSLGGKALYSERIPVGTFDYSFPTSQMPAGSYIVRLKGLTTSVERKVIVLH